MSGLVKTALKKTGVLLKVSKVDDVKIKRNAKLHVHVVILDHDLSGVHYQEPSSPTQALRVNPF